MKANGYKPVLAHPERYVFWHGNIAALKDVKAKGVLMQLNTNSINGYYNKGAQHTAELLIKNQMIDFIGTDCHAMKHLMNLKKVKSLKLYSSLLSNPLLNNTL